MEPDSKINKPFKGSTDLTNFNLLPDAIEEFNTTYKDIIHISTENQCLGIDVNNAVLPLCTLYSVRSYLIASKYKIDKRYPHLINYTEDAIGIIQSLIDCQLHELFDVSSKINKYMTL